jgi:restriction system protein
MIGMGRMGAGFGRLGAISPLRRAIESLNSAVDIVTLALSGILIPERPTVEGLLIKSYAAVWVEVARQLGQDWTLASQLTDRQWEEMLAGALDKEGYQVTLTPRSNDHGRDVIAVKSDAGCLRLLGSMKAYAPHRLVPGEHVHEMLGVLTAEGAGTVIIATTSGFAPRIREAPGLDQFIPDRIQLIDGPHLQKWLFDLSN